MGNPNPPSRVPSLTLPPGCRLYPSEEQILCCYLPKKNSSRVAVDPSSSSSVWFDPIKEINLYNFSPFDLPEITCFRFGYQGRKRHWYCYTERNGEERERRRAGIGFWKRKGRVRDVLGGRGGKAVLGRRSCFVFYMENRCGSDDADDCRNRGVMRTDWIMYEYALIGNQKDSFVLCRVFVKSRSQKSVSDIALSSCAEESVGTLRNIGIQHDGSITTNVGEAKVDERECFDKNDQPSGVSTRQDSQQSPVNPLSPVRSPRLVGLSVALATSILEGDFLELDDLI